MTAGEECLSRIECSQDFLLRQEEERYKLLQRRSQHCVFDSPQTAMAQALHSVTAALRASQPRKHRYALATEMLCAPTDSGAQAHIWYLHQENVALCRASWCSKHRCMSASTAAAFILSSAGRKVKDTGTSANIAANGFLLPCTLPQRQQIALPPIT